MRTLLGFLVGYVVGARAGGERFDEVVRAYDDIRRSEEFTTLVAVLRDHARATIVRAIDVLSPPLTPTSSPVERPTRRAGR